MRRPGAAGAAARRAARRDGSSSSSESEQEVSVIVGPPGPGGAARTRRSRRRRAGPPPRRPADRRRARGRGARRRRPGARALAPAPPAEDDAPTERARRNLQAALKQPSQQDLNEPDADAAPPPQDDHEVAPWKRLENKSRAATGRKRAQALGQVSDNFVRLDLTRKGTYRKRPTKKSDRRKFERQYARDDGDVGQRTTARRAIDGDYHQGVDVWRGRMYRGGQERFGGTELTGRQRAPVYHSRAVFGPACLKWLGNKGRRFWRAAAGGPVRPLWLVGTTRHGGPESSVVLLTGGRRGREA